MINQLLKSKVFLLLSVLGEILLLVICDFFYKPATIEPDISDEYFYHSTGVGIGEEKIAIFAVDWDSSELIAMEAIASQGSPMYIGDLYGNTNQILNSDKAFINGENPIVSPDQSKIAFIDFDQHKLHIVDNNENFDSLILFDTDVEAFAWTSDSTSIIGIEINRSLPEDKLKIRQYNVEPGNENTLFTYSDDNFFYGAELSVSPNGEYVAVSIIKVDNNNVKRISNVSDIHVISLKDQSIRKLNLNTISRNRDPIWLSNSNVMFISENINKLNTKVGNGNLINYNIDENCYSILTDYRGFRSIGLSANKENIVYLQGSNIYLKPVNIFLEEILSSGNICFDKVTQ